jgi:sporulation protein YlmC with PRC-barrel domain
MAGLALASGMAIGAQAQQTQDQTQSDMTTDPYGTDPTQSQTDATSDWSTEPDPGVEESDSQSASTYGDEYGDEIAHDMDDMTAESLNGKEVVTATGEEIGSIDEVGYSATHQERVAVVEAGGFLGVGEKRVAIPLSDLEMGTDDNVKTSLTRESIEAQEEFDEAGFTADEAGETGLMDSMEDHQPTDPTQDQ